MKQAETKFKEKVIEELKKLPNMWFCKIQQVSTSGTPDILMCLNGVFIAIELKTDTGKLSKLQEYNLDKIAKTGGISIVLAPKNLQETLEFLVKSSKELVHLYDRKIN